MAAPPTPQTYMLANLLAPADGKTHAVKFNVSLSPGNNAAINWPGLMQTVGAFVPQACTVDNSAGTSPVTMSETSYGWSRIIPAGAWRTFQFPAVSMPNFTFSSAGTVTPAVSLFDWPAFPDSDINIAVASGAPVTITGQPVSVALSGTMVPPSPVTYTAAGTTTITTGGASQTVFAAGTITTGAWVTNPKNATESLFVNVAGGTATTTPGGAVFELGAGETLVIGPSTNAITATAATLGHAFSAVRF